MELADVAARVAALGDELTGAAGHLRAADPGSRAFAADGPGALFAAGGALAEQWRTGLAARERETAAHSARLADLAGAVRQAAANYADAEDSAHQAHHREAG